MNKITKKAAIVLIGILSISLVAGNVLFAGSQTVIADDDVAFVSNGFAAGSGSGGNRDSQASADVITAEDIEFAAAPFNRTLAASGPSGSGSSQSVVNATDINYVRNGVSDTANLVCVADGSQVSGKVCVN
jgi:hypothetical protein